VGYATAAFALAVLEGNTQPGVWFPEEVSNEKPNFLRINKWKRS
jgi:hypothetical protein